MIYKWTHDAAVVGKPRFGNDGEKQGEAEEQMNIKKSRQTEREDRS